MVRETENLGDEPGTAAKRDEGRKVEAARNITVYESTRVIKNWEMMKIADTLIQNYPAMFRVLTELLNRQRAENIFAHYDKTCKGRPEGAYKILLAWMEWKQGYGSLGEVCCALRNHGFEELAESFPP